MKKNKNHVNQPVDDFDGFGDASSSEFDSDISSSASDVDDDLTDNQFSDEPAPPSPRRRRASGSLQAIAVFCIIGAMLLITVFVFLTRKGDTGESARAGTSVPAGATVLVAPGCKLLLNELLVTAEPQVDQKQLEVELLKLDGAVVGYLPLMNQYQVRFNTDTRSDLDSRKKALEDADGMIRVDYNYLLSLASDTREARPVTLPAVSERSLGLMGGLPPDDVSSMECYFLSSLTEPDAASFPDWLQGHRSSVPSLYRADLAAACLSQNGRQFFASLFYWQGNSDGTVTGSATSFALRYQLSCLVNAGAETIILPFMGPDVLDGSSLNDEIELNAMFFEALEKDHPSFTICKAWKKNDYLIHAIKGSDIGNRHLITVAAVDGEPLSGVLDAAGVNKSVYGTSGHIDGADLGAAGGNAEAAVSLVAAQLAAVRGREESDPSLLKNMLLGTCGVLAADMDSGAVLPALDPSSSGAVSSEPLHLIRMAAYDSRTGLVIKDAGFAVETAAGSFSGHTASDCLYVLLPAGSFNVSASADNYQRAALAVQSDHEFRVDLQMIPSQSSGRVSGRVLLRGSGIRDDLTAVLRTVPGGSIAVQKSIPENYELELPPGNYDLTVSGQNRTSVTVYGLSVAAGENTSVQDITLSEKSDMNGTISGMVKDAMTGGALEQAGLSFYAGANAPDTGSPVAAAVTDRNGNYSISLPGGMYTAYISKEGYRSDSMPVICEGEITIGDQDITITPKLAAGKIRIVLDWGAYPEDLDSHLVNKDQDIHLFYSSDKIRENNKEVIVERKNGEIVATLDVDALGSMKPDRSNRVETTTIQKLLPGKYTFYIHDYTNQAISDSTSLARSGAKVTVFLGDDDSKQVFEVPNEKGTLWEVFAFENGNLIPRNIVTNHVQPPTVGQ